MSLHSVERSEPASAVRVCPNPAIPDRPTAPTFGFERLVGRKGWARLTPDIRQRFAEKPAPDRPIRFVGVMEEVRCSAAGWVLAQACRVIGKPFAPHRGINVPVVITLRVDSVGDVIWERQYHYPDRGVERVSSVKRHDADGSLLECVGSGLGMRLAVFEVNRALHFLSLHYFWQFGARRYRLPRWLSPGTAHVVHTDLGQGRFRFTLTLHNRLFGTLFHQTGVFCRQGVST